MEELVVDLFNKFPVMATILAGLLAAHGLATFIVNTTKTPRDNEIYGKVYKVVEWAALIVSPKAKEKGDD